MSCLHSKYKTTVQPHAYAFHLGRIFPIRYLLGFMPRSRRCCWDPSHPPLFQCQEGGKYLSLGRSLAHSPSTWATGNARTKSVGCKASILIFSAGPKTTFLAGKHLILESIFHIWELQAWCQGHGLLLGTTTSAFFPDPLPKTCFPILLKIGVGEDTWLCSRGHSWCSDERRCQGCNQMIVCVRACARKASTQFPAQSLLPSSPEIQFRCLVGFTPSDTQVTLGSGQGTKWDAGAKHVTWLCYPSCPIRVHLETN